MNEMDAHIVEVSAWLWHAKQKVDIEIVTVQLIIIGYSPAEPDNYK